MLSSYEKSLLNRLFDIRKLLFNEVDIIEKKIRNNESFTKEEQSQLIYIYTLEKVQDKSGQITSEDII